MSAKLDCAVVVDVLVLQRLNKHWGSNSPAREEGERDGQSKQEELPAVTCHKWHCRPRTYQLSNSGLPALLNEPAIQTVLIEEQNRLFVQHARLSANRNEPLISRVLTKRPGWSHLRGD